MTWHFVAGALALIIAAFAGLGWLVLEGPERRAYGWVALATAMAAYWLIPWEKIPLPG